MLERNQLEIQQKLQAQMEKDGLSAMIVTTPEAVFYCTGFASQFLYISNRIGMAMAVVPKTGKVTLLVSACSRRSPSHSRRSRLGPSSKKSCMQLRNVRVATRSMASSSGVPEKGARA